LSKSKGAKEKKRVKNEKKEKPSVQTAEYLPQSGRKCGKLRVISEKGRSYPLETF